MVSVVLLVVAIEVFVDEYVKSSELHHVSVLMWEESVNAYLPTQTVRSLVMLNELGNSTYSACGHMRQFDESSVTEDVAANVADEELLLDMYLPAELLMV